MKIGWTLQDLQEQKPDKKVHEAAIEAIGPILVGLSPQNQGAILADLVAMWLSGWTPELRDGNFELFQSLVKDLLPLYADHFEGAEENLNDDGTLKTN